MTIMIETVPHIITDVHSGIRMAELSKAHRFERPVTLVVRGSSPGMTISYFLLESN